MHSTSIAYPAPSQVRQSLAEIACRYAWLRRDLRQQETDPRRRMAKLRLREIERLYAFRYGHTLPDDDAGRDDLTVAAHHIAHLYGDAVAHVVAWASLWAPWLPQGEAEQLAQDIVAQPIKWKADTLAWRLGLTAAERTELRITTIGAIDQNKAEREIAKKERQREAAKERRRRRALAAGRIPSTAGRPPKKPVVGREDSIAGDGFSANGSEAARTAAAECMAEPLQKNKPVPGQAPRSQEEVVLVGSGDGVPPLGDHRADQRQEQQDAPCRTPSAAVPTEPTPEIIAKATEEIRRAGRRMMTGQALAVLRRNWPRYVREISSDGLRHYSANRLPGYFAQWWPIYFHGDLVREADARDRYRRRRQKWQEQLRERRGLIERSRQARQEASLYLRAVDIRCKVQEAERRRAEYEHLQRSRALRERLYAEHRARMTGDGATV